MTQSIERKCSKCNESNPLNAEYCWKCYFDFIPNTSGQRFSRKFSVVTAESASEKSWLSTMSKHAISVGFVSAFFILMRLALSYMKSRDLDSISVGILMVLGNIPIYLVLGRIVFGSIEKFGEAFRFYITPDLVSLMFGEFLRDFWQSLKFVLWLILCISAVRLEYVYF